MLVPSDGGYISRPSPSGLADVVDVILDKGLVVDAFARVALAGIELVAVDARLVLASVDTYLRFAEASARLELGSTAEAATIPELVGDVGSKVIEDVAKRRVKETLEEVRERVTPSRGQTLAIAGLVGGASAIAARRAFRKEPG